MGGKPEEAGGEGRDEAAGLVAGQPGGSLPGVAAAAVRHEVLFVVGAAVADRAWSTSAVSITLVVGAVSVMVRARAGAGVADVGHPDV